MLDLIKTFVLNILIDKRYRYVFIFITITLCYRCSKWLYVIQQNPLMPVKFVRINKDGSLSFRIGHFYQDMYSKEYQLPSLKSFDMCEKEYYNKIYTKYIKSLIQSANKNQFMIKFDKKIPKKVGKIFYDYAGLDEEREVFENLHKNNIIFEIDKEIDYCVLLRKHHIYIQDK